MVQGLSPREIEQLTAPFSDEVLDVNQGFIYVPIEHVIERLNTVFNYNWDCVPYKIEKGEKETRSSKSGEKTFEVTPIYITVVLTVRSETGAVITRAGCGGSISGYGKSEGDGHKGAMSDAIRKAAQSLGVALYIAMDARAERKKQKGSYKKYSPKFTPQPQGQQSVMRPPVPHQAAPGGQPGFHPPLQTQVQQPQQPPQGGRFMPPKLM